jgi:hypothetical protein
MILTSDLTAHPDRFSRRSRGAFRECDGASDPGAPLLGLSKIADDYERTYVGEVSFANWGRRGPIPPGLRSLQKLVNVG